MADERAGEVADHLDAGQPSAHLVGIVSFQIVPGNTPLSMSAAPAMARQIIALHEPNQKAIAASTRDAP